MKSAEIKDMSIQDLQERIEAEGVPLAIAQEALRLGAQKLPIKVKFIVRRDYTENAI